MVAPDGGAIGNYGQIRGVRDIYTWGWGGDGGGVLSVNCLPGVLDFWEGSLTLRKTPIY